MSSFLAFLNHWWNLPFLVMLLIVAAYFVLQLVGLVGSGDADHDAAGGSAGGGDADGDAAHDHHHDADGQDAQHGAGDAWHDALAFFGVGRVPFMVVWVTLFIFAGFTGLIVNRVVYLNLGLGAGGPAPVWMFPAALGAALVVGLAGVRFFARAAARLVDVGGNGSTSKKQLVGRFGVVASGTLDARFGEVRVHDGKDEILVHGRLQGGEAALARGARVVLVDYDDASDLYWVTISPDVDAAA